MNAFRIHFGLLAATAAILALPQAASAAYYVPPSNSAATQYTESFPTAGGDRDAENGAGKHHSPTKVLGSRNTQRLESQGPEGRAVAEIAAETAPTGAATATTTAQKPKNKNGNGSAAARGGTEKTSGSSASGTSQGPSAASQTLDPSGSSGSSGLGEVIAQATGGTSSGGLGLLLPLTLLGGVAWAAIYLSSKRRRKPAA